MYLVGHIGITIFFFFVFSKLVESDYSKFYLFIGLGSLLPDIIDKPIGAILFEKGRWFGHSVIFLTLIFVILFIIFTEQKFNEIQIRDILKVIYVSSLIHLLEDGRGLTLNIVFWPFNGGIPKGSPGDFLHGFQDTLTIFFEIVGVILLVVIGISEKWNLRQWKLLFALIIGYLSTFTIAYLTII